MHGQRARDLPPAGYDSVIHSDSQRRMSSAATLTPDRKTPAAPEEALVALISRVCTSSWAEIVKRQLAANRHGDQAVRYSASELLTAGKSETLTIEGRGLSALRRGISGDAGRCTTQRIVPVDDRTRSRALAAVVSI